MPFYVISLHRHTYNNLCLNYDSCNEMMVLKSAFEKRDFFIILKVSPITHILLMAKLNINGIMPLGNWLGLEPVIFS